MFSENSGKVYADAERKALKKRGFCSMSTAAPGAGLGPAKTEDSPAPDSGAAIARKETSDHGV